jgi:hypothetical protein
MNHQHYVKLFPVIQAFVEGKTIQVRTGDSRWEDVQTDQALLTFALSPDHYRVKPEKFEVTEERARDAIRDYYSDNMESPQQAMKSLLSDFATELLKKVKNGEISLDDYDLT